MTHLRLSPGDKTLGCILCTRCNQKNPSVQGKSVKVTPSDDDPTSSTLCSYEAFHASLSWKYILPRTLGYLPYIKSGICGSILRTFMLRMAVSGTSVRGEIGEICGVDACHLGCSCAHTFFLAHERPQHDTSL